MRAHLILLIDDKPGNHKHMGELRKAQMWYVSTNEECDRRVVDAWRRVLVILKHVKYDQLGLMRDGDVDFDAAWKRVLEHVKRISNEEPVDRAVVKRLRDKIDAVAEEN